MGKRRKPDREPPKVFAWFFEHHVFDVVRAREIAARKPVLNLTTVQVSALLDDGAPDLDLTRVADPRAVVILARVPIGDGKERYVLIDGYEVVKKCEQLGRPLRLRLLSRAEAKKARIAADSVGEWPD
jgi:hypothetical protein